MMNLIINVLIILLLVLVLIADIILRFETKELEKLYMETDELLKRVLHNLGDKNDNTI